MLVPLDTGLSQHFDSDDRVASPLLSKAGDSLILITACTKKDRDREWGHMRWRKKEEGWCYFCQHHNSFMTL